MSSYCARKGLLFYGNNIGFSSSIKDLDKNQDDLSKEMEQIRSKFRRCEREWLAEKETLYRKLQLCQQLGGAATAGRMADVNAGFFTDQRSAVRLAGESRLQKKLQKVNVSDLQFSIDQDLFLTVPPSNSLNWPIKSLPRRATGASCWPWRPRWTCSESRIRTERQRYRCVIFRSPCINFDFLHVHI